MIDIASGEVEDRQPPPTLSGKDPAAAGFDGETVRAAPRSGAASQAKAIGVIWDSTNPTPGFAVEEAQAAGRSIGVQTLVLSAGTENEIEAVFAAFAREGVGAVFVNNSFFFFSLRDRLAALAARYRMALSGELRAFVEVGGLMSYGASLTDSYRQVGVYTARILKGTKPADLPVLQSSKFELVINHQTAKALGLDVPPGLLARADEVIE